MRFDLRLPIGVLFVVYGAIIALRGALVATPVLGININLYWGVVMLLFGGGCLFLGSRRTKRDRR